MIIHPNFNHPWQYFITTCWQEKVGFWPMNELIIIHDNTYSLIYKKCHPQTYHSDNKCHVTLNIIFGVITNEPVHFPKSPIQNQTLRNQLYHIYWNTFVILPTENKEVRIATKLARISPYSLAFSPSPQKPIPMNRLQREIIWWENSSTFLQLVKRISSPTIVSPTYH